MKSKSHVSLALSFFVGLWAGASSAWGQMYIAGDGWPGNTDPQQYARFYSGSDKAFIGQAYNWSGVGSDGYSWATMISPTFFISANHDHPGSTLTFYSGNSLS